MKLTLTSAEGFPYVYIGTILQITAPRPMKVIVTKRHGFNSIDVNSLHWWNFIYYWIKYAK